jgi:hypothetical protein
MFFTFLPSQPVFLRVWPSQPDFAGFRVLTPILHVFCVLTRKIGRFYELKRIFNNHVWTDSGFKKIRIKIDPTWFNQKPGLTRSIRD